MAASGWLTSTEYRFFVYGGEPDTGDVIDELAYIGHPPDAIVQWSARDDDAWNETSSSPRWEVVVKVAS